MAQMDVPMDSEMDSFRHSWKNRPPKTVQNTGQGPEMDGLAGYVQP
jgi:hypothetical protein